MDKLRIYADLNRWEEVEGQFRVILTTRGTHQDLEKYKIVLKEGLLLDFWMDDGDADGSFDSLYFQGTLHRDERAGRWVAVVDRDAIRHASETQATESTVYQKAGEPSLV